ncbi:Uncharacterized protein Rs2_08851 [Raphanus sativus]|nr:Uncharacterized protein Rs2_08851 [Raphanus sativus]
MASIKALAELVPFKTKHGIRVKIITKWNAATGFFSHKKSMLLGDAKGFKIEATIDDERTLPDGIILEVGAWFEIYNFKLTRSSGFIRPTKNIEEEPAEIVGSMTKRMKFSLINIGLTQIKCVAYGRQAQELYDLWSSTTANTVICVLRLWRIEWGQDGFQYMTNTDFSEILFDHDIPEIKDFQSRIPKNSY